MLYMHDKKVILDAPDQNNISVRTETKRYLACYYTITISQYY